MNTIDKFSNYNYYAVCSGATKISEPRLRKVIEMVRDRNKGKGYVRFMLAREKSEPMCILYSDNKGTERLTKLITLTELENLLNK